LDVIAYELFVLGIHLQAVLAIGLVLVLFVPSALREVAGVPIGIGTAHLRPVVIDAAVAVEQYVLARVEVQVT
jgi:hypothetical protein